MDFQKSRQAISVLEAAADNATGLVREAILGSVAVAKRALDDCEQMQTKADEATAIAKAAAVAVEKAAVSEEQAREELADEKRAQRRKVAKSVEAFQEAAIQKSIGDVVKAWNEATPLLAQLLAIRRWTHRADSQLSVLSDLRKSGEIQVLNPSTGDITIITGKDARAQAVALVKHYVETYVDLAASKIKLEDLDVSLEKDWIGINDNRPEPKNQGGQGWNGAAAKIPTLGDCGPKIADEDDEDE